MLARELLQDAAQVRVPVVGVEADRSHWATPGSKRQIRRRKRSACSIAPSPSVECRGFRHGAPSLASAGCGGGLGRGRVPCALASPIPAFPRKRGKERDSLRCATSPQRQSRRSPRWASRTRPEARVAVRYGTLTPARSLRRRGPRPLRTSLLLALLRASVPVAAGVDLSAESSLVSPAHSQSLLESVVGHGGPKRPRF